MNKYIEERLKFYSDRGYKIVEMEITEDHLLEFLQSIHLFEKYSYKLSYLSDKGSFYQFGFEDINDEI